jgi:hypothetical protein
LIGWLYAPDGRRLGGEASLNANALAWAIFLRLRDASPILGTRRYPTNERLFKMLIMMYLRNDSFRVIGGIFECIAFPGFYPGLSTLSPFGAFSSFDFVQ